MEIQLWREILSPYEQAVTELVEKFQHLSLEHRERGLYSPIEQVTGRVKSITSILEKMKRKNIPFEEMEEQVEDIAGIRIICQFVEDIQRVSDLIAGRSDMEIKCIKDYIAHQKESGYRSYHLVIYYHVETLNGPKKIQAEIQIRTMAMNFWATIEHSLQYKYKTNIPPYVKERLANAAQAIIALDGEMSSVRNEIMNAQNSSLMQRNLVMDILQNIENLYQKSNRREVEKIQDEFYRIYASNDLQQLKRFHQQLDIIAEDLGFLTPSVLKLVKDTGFPGMKVLEFAFDSREESDYLPHNYTTNCVVYTGTHDNNTIRGWYEEMDEADRQLSIDYMNNAHTPEDEIHWDFVRLALASVAKLAVIPVQDYLGLGGEARINTPSTLGENWRWRMLSGEMTDEIAVKCRKMAKLYGRV